MTRDIVRILLDVTTSARRDTKITTGCYEFVVGGPRHDKNDGGVEQCR